MIIGEGTNEIQRLIICRNLLERYGERPGALTSRDELPEEQRQLVLAVRQAVEKDVVPVAAEQDQGRRDPEPLVAQLAELGIFGALADAEHGGLGLPLATAAMIVEEVARGSAALAIWLSAQLAATLAVARSVPRDARERLLPPMTRGERWTAPVVGASIGARRAGADWVLTGAAPVVPNAGRAKLFLVNAALEDGGDPLLHGRVGPGRPHGGPGLRHHRPPRPRRGGRGPGRRAARRARPRSAKAARRCSRPRPMSAPPPPRWGSPRPPSRRRCATPSSGPPSGSRSASTRRCSSSWPTWRPRSPRRAC